MKDQLPALDGAAQLAGKCQVADAVLVLLGVVDGKTGLFLLGRVHCHVGHLNETGGFVSVLGEHGDADAGTDIEGEFRQLERLFKRPEYLAGQPAGGLEIGCLWQQQGEFIAAEPRHRIRFPHMFLETRTNLLQQDVPHVVSQGIVDLLETVKVDEQYRERFIRPLGERDGAFQAVEKQRAVGETGQGVVQGLMFQRLLPLFSQGDVADEGGQKPAVVRANLGDRRFHGKDPTVFAAPLRLVRSAADLERIGQILVPALFAQPGNEKADVPADNLAGRIIEHPGGGGVDRFDNALAVHGDDTVEAVFHDVAHHDVLAPDIDALKQQAHRLLVDAADQGNGVSQQDHEDPRRDVDQDRRQGLHRKRQRPENGGGRKSDGQAAAP